MVAWMALRWHKGPRHQWKPRFQSLGRSPPLLYGAYPHPPKTADSWSALCFEKGICKPSRQFSWFWRHSRIKTLFLCFRRVEFGSPDPPRENVFFRFFFASSTSYPLPSEKVDSRYHFCILYGPSWTQLGVNLTPSSTISPLTWTEIATKNRSWFRKRCPERFQDPSRLWFLQILAPRGSNVFDFRPLFMFCFQANKNGLSLFMPWDTQ